MKQLNLIYFLIKGFSCLAVYQINSLKYNYTYRTACYVNPKSNLFTNKDSGRE